MGSVLGICLKAVVTEDASFITAMATVKRKRFGKQSPHTVAAEEVEEERGVTNDPRDSEVDVVTPGKTGRGGYQPIRYEVEVAKAHSGRNRLKDSSRVLAWLQVAANGKVSEFERLYKLDPTRLEIKDSKGQNALHHAAKNGRLEIIKFISKIKTVQEALRQTEEVKKKQAERRTLLSRCRRGTEVIKSNSKLKYLNEEDNEGNTALHLAALKNQAAVIPVLLDLGASSDVLNKSGNGAIHEAVALDHRDSLTALCKHPSVDVNLAGDRGVTAMHVAAFRDRHECAHILLENGTKLCKPCEAGMLPVHMATLHGASNTLEVIMIYAQKAGYTRAQVLKLQDSCHNMPLHTAVAGGDIRAVNLCLNAGAQISSMQSDNSTAVHLAASQGNLDMIQAMFEAQPENVETTINAVDVVEMTPLHKAALFNRTNVIEYLIEKGSNVNEQDKGGMSPLLLAAARRAWGSVELLIKNGSDVTVRDKKNRNILHLIIKNGGKPEQFSFCMCNMKVVDLSNEQDEFGCTPLHYASQQGLLKTIDSLLDMGAQLNAKNNNRESPLHFAASHGRINTCQRLLDSKTGRNIINETNGDGQTPLHAAAKNGHTKVVTMLLHRGASILKDREGNTALHLAAQEGFTHTVQTLLNVHSHLLNSINKIGDTPLHMASRDGHVGVVTLLMSLQASFEKNSKFEHFVDLAIANEHKDVLAAIVSHDRWDTALRYNSDIYSCPMVGLIKHVPEVCQMVLDRCRKASTHDRNCGDFTYTYDFRFLDIEPDVAEKLKREGKDRMPLYAMNIMVQFNRVECLSHPVCLTFLKMKWRAYGMWFWVTNLLTYLVFLASLTAFIVAYHGGGGVGSITTPATNNTTNNSLGTTPASHWADQNRDYSQMDPGLKLTILIILIFGVLNMVKEILQMFQQKLKYFGDLNNYLEWTLYITSTVFVAPFIAGVSTSLQWECGAIAVFCAWYNLLLFLQRFDLYGIYVVMFLEILRTLIQVLLIFSILIIAFSLSFYAIMYTDRTEIQRASVAGHQARINSLNTETMTFSTPLLSVMTVVMMMLGNIEYIDSWVNPSSDASNNTLHFATLSYILLAVFVILMPILLMNLLIGLAVGDIEAVQKDATLKRLAMQVELHSDLERKLPARFLKYAHKPTYVIHPNCTQFFLSRVFQRVTRTSDQDFQGASDNNGGNDTYVYQELYNHKRRLKTIQGQLDRQYDLLRLIVQKMEIKTEADDMDESVNCPTGNGDGEAQSQLKGVSWSNPALRTTLMKQASVLAKWGKSIEPKKGSK